MHLELREITPVLTVSGIVLGPIASLDYVLRDDYKRRAFQFFASLAQIGNRPRTWKFYCLMCAVSVGFTLAIISINGTLANLGGESRSLLLAVKSSGALALAIFLKVTLWDYILALKSHGIFRIFQRIYPGPPIMVQKRFSRKLALILLVVICDLWITGVLTGGLLNWSDAFQSQHINNVKHSIPGGIVKALSDFFDDISLVAADSIRKCFYVLNGSLFMYAALAFAALASRSGRYINAEEMPKHVFKILATCSLLIVMVIVVCYKLAD